jgi:hypothetical protein
LVWLLVAYCSSLKRLKLINYQYHWIFPSRDRYWRIVAQQSDA